MQSHDCGSGARGEETALRSLELSQPSQGCTLLSDQSSVRDYYKFKMCFEMEMLCHNRAEFTQDTHIDTQCFKTACGLFLAMWLGDCNHMIILTDYCFSSVTYFIEGWMLTIDSRWFPRERDLRIRVRKSNMM